jgi:hypothetical protein
MLFLVGGLLAATLGATGSVPGATAPDYDVVVYGSSPAGIAAATAAGQLGMRVALYEPLQMLGGMGAAGNLALHDGNTKSGGAQLTGLSLNFSLRNAAHYGVAQPVAQPESFVANASFYEMLEGAGVAKIALDCRLTAAAATAAAGDTADSTSGVASITVLCEPAPVTATVFIDASYDGEIMVAVGNVDYTAGREAAAQYNESLGGARVPTAAHPTFDALRSDGTLLKYVQNISELAAPGEADDALMAFQHRMCISGDADRLPWAAPAGYDREDFLLFERYIAASGGTPGQERFTGFGWPPQNMHDHGYPGPKKKYTLCCGVTTAASDQPHLNAGWASATWDRKQQIIADHTYFELGMFYFLSHDAAVPQAIRDDFNAYGLCADEFAEFDHIPPQLYIRASNRLVGDYVMTQNTIASPPYQHDGIATSHWWLDQHMTGKYGVPNANGDGSFTVQLEGNFPHEAASTPPPYDVPFRLLLPKRGTGANLLVPVAMSVSNAAFASTRIETMLMSVGTAAGVAAQQLVDGSVGAVQDVDVSKVQAILTGTFKQAIHVSPAPTPAVPTACDATKASAITVAGAGTGAANGRYVRTNAAAPTFQLDAAHQLYAYQGQWRIAHEGVHGSIAYTDSNSQGRSGPSVAAAWTVAPAGVAPAPSSIVCEA